MTQQIAPQPDSGEDFSRRFRNALGMFATGITVVTTRTSAGEPIGLTVNSFNSVSLEPPLIVWSLANSLPSRELFEGCEYYAINVLAEGQAELSQRFAGRMGEKFAGLEIDEGPGGVPLLKGCCARFICRNTVRHAGGDHVVFISEVIGFDRDERAPLVYFGGGYRRLAP
jgi:flavin reductase (DIM6/NTAB) family NADH-FMN oxidoreductase RutF